MHPGLNQLMGLQREDVEARRLREEMAALPRQVAALETKAKATVGQRAVVLDLLRKEEALRRSQESDIGTLKARGERARRQMDTAADSKQVAALEHEIAFTAREINSLEDAELESMERSEGLEAQRRVADRAVADDEQRHQTERERAIATVDAHRAALATIDSRRATQRGAIAEDLLSLYDRIARGKGTALAEVSMQKCLACQMMVRPQKWNDLRDRSNHELLTCDSCGRLLWYDPARDAPQRKPADVAFDGMSIAARIVRGL